MGTTIIGNYKILYTVNDVTNSHKLAQNWSLKQTKRTWHQCLHHSKITIIKKLLFIVVIEEMTENMKTHSAWKLPYSNENVLFMKTNN